MPFETIVVKGTSNGYEDASVGYPVGLRTAEDIAKDVTVVYETIEQRGGRLIGILNMANAIPPKKGPDLLFTYFYNEDNQDMPKVEIDYAIPHGSCIDAGRSCGPGCEISNEPYFHKRGIASGADYLRHGSCMDAGDSCGPDCVIAQPAICRYCSGSYVCADHAGGQPVYEC